MYALRLILGIVAVVLVAGVGVGLATAALGLPPPVTPIACAIFATAGFVHLIRREERRSERARASRPALAKGNRYEVRFDDDAIEVLTNDEPSSRVCWLDLLTVAITIEDHVFLTVPWWRLFARDGTSASWPSDALGWREVVDEMQRRLPGFDNAEVVRGMGMADGGVLVWERVGETPASA